MKLRGVRPAAITSSGSGHRDRGVGRSAERQGFRHYAGGTRLSGGRGGAQRLHRHPRLARTGANHSRIDIGHSVSGELLDEAAKVVAQYQAARVSGSGSGSVFGATPGPSSTTWRLPTPARVSSAPRERSDWSDALRGNRIGIAADWDAVFAAAAESGVAMEIDGAPARQDLDYGIARRALDAGWVFALDSGWGTRGRIRPYR